MFLYAFVPAPLGEVDAVIGFARPNGCLKGVGRVKEGWGRMIIVACLCFQMCLNEGVRRVG
jgi:hypothetical protein